MREKWAFEMFFFEYKAWNSISVNRKKSTSYKCEKKSEKSNSFEQELKRSFLRRKGQNEPQLLPGFLKNLDC